MNHTTQTGGELVRRRLWLTAGWLAIGYIVLTVVANIFEYQLELGQSRHDQIKQLVQSSLTRNYAGGYIEYLSYLIFLVGALLFARLLRGDRDDDTAGWMSSCISGSAVAYVAITIATGFAAGAAALYGAHHGVALDTAVTVNHIRDFAFYMSGGVLGVFAICVGVAGRATGALPRWLSYAGMVVGALGIVAVPAARVGFVNVSTLLFFVWILLLGVSALRNGRTRAARSAAVAATA